MRRLRFLMRSATAPQYIGFVILTFAIVSVVLQLSFLESLCNEGMTRILTKVEISQDASSQSYLRRSDETVNHIESPHNKGDLIPTAKDDTRPIRVLVGVFTTDDTVERRCRHRQRRLFRLHPHTCTLASYLSDKPESCRLIYTFVTGANPHGPTMQVDSSIPFAIDHNSVPTKFTEKDMLESDVTLLNIKENMNEGKSQTWFAYGAQLAKEYEIDYIVKQDTDTILFLDKYFDFVDHSLPPAPYNRNILAGSVADKLWWGEGPVNRKALAEQWAIRRYGGLLHLYAEGQWYLMSPDLAETVQQEAVKQSETEQYFAGHEDHDVSAMAFHSTRPIQLIIISLQQRHWKHKVKLTTLGATWNKLWEEETNRMRGVVESYFSQ